MACDTSTGLEPVSGVEGKITFHGTWDENIKASAIIALDQLDFENLAANLITYSNLIEPGSASGEYFIQLLPGRYYLGAVGITVDPVFFAVKIDSFLSAPNIPIELIDKSYKNLSEIIVNPGEITVVDREINF
jgi:hypothetical protein